MYACLRESGRLHGILERADAAALGDEIGDILSATILGAQLVADISAYTSWVVSEAVASGVGWRRGADCWAHGSFGKVSSTVSEMCFGFRESYPRLTVILVPLATLHRFICRS
jgi:hypothetical protein